MRIALMLFLIVATVLISESTACQPFNATEMTSAREAARSWLIRYAESIQVNQESREQAANAFGLTDDRPRKLAGANLGEPFLIYRISKEVMKTLTRIDDIYVMAELRGVEFPVLIDDRLTLSISVRQAVDSTTKEVVWRLGQFGGANGIGKRVVELSKKYPRAEGYEMTRLFLTVEADFMIIKRASDYVVYHGWRDFGGRTWPRHKEEFDHIVPTQEFIEILKCYASRERGQGLF